MSKSNIKFLIFWKIVRDLDPKEYQEFLEERKKVVQDQLQALKEKKEAKMIRA